MLPKMRTAQMRAEGLRSRYPILPGRLPFSGSFDELVVEDEPVPRIVAAANLSLSSRH